MMEASLFQEIGKQKKEHFPSFPKKITCIFVTSAVTQTKPEMCILFCHDDTLYCRLYTLYCMQNTCQTLLPIVVLTLSVFIRITNERKYDVKAKC